MTTCLQRDSNDCGVACLQAIMIYHGKYIQSETIRNSAFVYGGGAKLIDLKTAANTFCFATKVYQLSIQALCTNFKEPCILHWNQNHYVVLYKIRFQRNKYFFYIMDPGVGKIKLEANVFEKSWLNSSDITGQIDTGVALALKPTPEFQKLASEKESFQVNFKEIFKYFEKYKKAILYIIFCILATNALQFLLPFLTQNIIDAGIELSDKEIIKIILIGQALIYVSSSCFEYVRRSLLLHVNSRVNIILVSDFLHKLVRLPMRFFESKIVGDLLQRIYDHTKIENFLTSVITDAIFSLSSFIMFSIVLLIYSTKIFIIFILFSLAYIFWIYLFLAKRKEIDYIRFLFLSANSNNLIEYIEGMKDIKLYNSHHKKRWEWEAVQIRLFNLNMNSLTIEQYQSIGSLLINQSKNIILTFISAQMVIDNQLSLGMMLSIQFIIGQLEGPINKTIEMMHSWQDAKISFSRLSEIQQIKNEDDTTKKSLPSTDIYDINIKNISFRYGGPHSPLVLKNINLCIPAGKTTAIVGVSGSGKTTLIKLLLGFYPATSGDILIGNHNINAINMDSWRNQCSVILQDSYIFNDTIENNINLTENSTDFERLHFAVDKANFKDIVDSLPSKYKTKIGANGHGLSNGQLQRLLIARSIYKNADYVFFDEFTNSLDAQNEAAIMVNLKTINKDKTRIIIAHRFSTIKNADQIVVLHNGMIVEVGNHEQLIQNNNTYCTLMKEQLNLN